MNTGEARSVGIQRSARLISTEHSQNVSEKHFFSHFPP